MPEIQDKPNGQVNGEVSRPELLEKLAGEPLSAGYKPTLPYWAMASGDGMRPQISITRDIELMRIHPTVKMAMSMYRSGIYGAEFELEDATNDEIGNFAMSQVKHFWDMGMPTVQHGYEYGWIGGEYLYSDSEGMLKWSGIRDFSPWDTFLLTQDNTPVGVRIKNVLSSDPIDLWMGSTDVPAKALWYAHEPRYGSHYGCSQYLGSWRSWRRLAWKDAAESVVDGGVYRFAYQGPVVRFPEEDFAAPVGTPYTTIDANGVARRYARDIARQMAETAKAGAAIGMPSTQYPAEMGGGNKWDFDWPTSTINVDGLINYVNYLKKEIQAGMEVPPELMDAAETGSGYSGRKIPLEAFLVGQQRVGNRILAMFVREVLMPLARWNWGPQAFFRIKLKSLLQTKNQQQMGATDQAGLADQNAAAAETEQTGTATPGWPRADNEAMKAQSQQSQQWQAAFSLAFPEIDQIAQSILRAA